MANLSQIKREKLISFLETLKEQHLSSRNWRDRA